jgi:5,10-methylenetetrahydromethanopterin reductase
VDEVKRKLEEIDIVAYTSFSISDSSEKAKDAAKPIVAFIIAATPQVVLERHGIHIQEASRVKDAIVSGKIGDAIANVTQAMLDAFCVYGTPAECIRKIEEISKTGVTQFVVGSPIGPDPSTSIELVEHEIIPSFG